MLAMSAAAAPASAIIDVGGGDFQQTVLYGSLQKPVIAYFTAAWCGPCKQLGPLMEKVAKDYVGKLQIARVDIDAAPEIASALRVQSVPMVYAFVGGQPADGFMGAVPESELRSFFNRILQMAGIAAPAAVDKATDPADPFAAVLCDWGDGNLVAAQMGLNDLSSEDPKITSRAEAFRALFTALLPHGSQQALQQAQGAQPTNAETAFKHAQALLAHGQLNDGIAALLASIKTDRKWQEEAARQLLLQLFDALGFEHPLSIQGRKDLSKVLFS